MNNLIIITLCSLFFPVYFRFMGKDAMTSGSIMCGLLFCVFIVRKLLTRKPGFKFAIIGSGLIVVALISTLTVPAPFFGTSFRRFVQFACSICLFFTIINYYSEFEHQEQKEKIEFILSLIIGLMALQIVIGVIIFVYPPFGKLFAVFTTRTVDIIQTSVTDRTIKRLSCLISGGESMGEIIAVMSPLVLYKLIKTKSVYNYSLFFLYIAGCFLTVTRSSILLMLTGLFLFAVINRKQIHLSLWIMLSYLLVLISVSIIFYFPDIFEPVITRFQKAFTSYEKTSSIAATINRGGLWEFTYGDVISNISLFGHGMISLIGNHTINLHNLYFSMLHQTGIVGFILMLILLFRIAYSLIKSLVNSFKQLGNTEFSLISACLISFFIFLINEIKFEFTRHASYEQICFSLFAFYLLVSYHAMDANFNRGRQHTKSSQSYQN